MGRSLLGIALLLPALPGYAAQRNPNKVVERVLDDMDRSQGYNYFASKDRKRFDNAHKDLLKFQDKWTQGHYDGGKLDSAISNLDHLVQSTEVRQEDRERLRRDLQDLREVRARREYNAARRPPRPPRPPRRWPW